MPIRWRLTLWFSLILCAILVLSGGVLYVVLGRYLYAEIDDSLRTYSASVHGTLLNEDTPGSLDFGVVHSMLPAINEFAFPGVYIQLVDHRGNVVVKSDNLGQQELPVDPALVEEGFSGRAVIRTVAAGGKASVRMMVSPLLLKDETLVLEVARSLQHVDTAMRRVTEALGASLLLSLVLAGVSGGAIVRSALRPVEEITRTASSIEAGADLSRRVGHAGPPDEIGRLATTFDGMIGRLDRAFALQRDFIADASHELRTPLTVIQGNLDLLKRNLSEEDRRESLRAMESEVKRMSKIAGDLLLLAEVESGRTERRELVNLRDLAMAAVQEGRKLSASHRIEAGRLEDLSVSGDGELLARLLRNLVENAVRYTPEGGSVTVSVRHAGDCARLDVTDTGIGIPAEHLPHVFERFYRVDKARSRARGGSGLGLAIVREIAEKHGGRASVDSEPGKGSTFSVWLRFSPASKSPLSPA